MLASTLVTLTHLEARATAPPGLTVTPQAMSLKILPIEMLLVSLMMVMVLVVISLLATALKGLTATPQAMSLKILPIEMLLVSLCPPPFHLQQCLQLRLWSNTRQRLDRGGFLPHN